VVRVGEYIPILGASFLSCPDPLGQHEICSAYSCPHSVACFLGEAGLPFVARLLENFLMRLLLIPVVFCTLGAYASSAQTIPAPATTLRLLPSAAQFKQTERDNAITDCMRMWDAGTHMTKQEWARTCKRVQSRLDSLKVDWLIPETKKKVR
jgi:hypothetical protein